MSDKKKQPGYIKYLFGGLAGMGATCVVQPLDLVKTRMQIQGEGGAAREYKNTFDAFTGILKKEGVSGIYRGIGAGLLRQATYTTTRLGVFTALSETYRQHQNKAPGLLERMGMGMIAGATGAFVGTPAEVSLIRMTADGRLPLAERRNYTSVVNALSRIAKEEGVLMLWRGCIPTMGRAMVVNMAQLASYSQAKEYLLSTGKFADGIQTHFVASMISGFITTAASMPVDIAKTRIQNMKVVDGKPEYRGAVDVILKVVRNEGIFALWKGFTPYFARLGPHTVLTFILLEQMNAAYNSRVLGQSGGSSGL
ncbi:mitochondrial 2-oxoglutarate/malate carrier protein [Phlebotomus argentipes]|uniref:mitochondrial 2-oxoglutarate/malate carrier protein n=1 Tax=Phlebotomus argentipes TaxID=94469 RepID=UPI0028933705|nr:mitochondrial 2-oxoglutarate/malate carrier protein [Phlebotomus argentipes]